MSAVDNSSSCTSSSRDIDPLLKDLNEKRQIFRRNVVSLAAELKEVRSRLSLQEQSYAKESMTRQEAEKRAKNMEEEICRLQKRLEERNDQLKVSAITVEKYVEELDGLRSRLLTTQATADASAATAQSAELQCLALLKELDEKNSCLEEHEGRVTRLGEQLDNLQKDLQAREFSQKQLKDEVIRIEHGIVQAISQAGSNKDCELRKILDEASPKNFEKINEHLTVKDEEIAKLKDEIRIISAQWKLKTKEWESQICLSLSASVFFFVNSINLFIYNIQFVWYQLEKQRRADQELKKRVLKLEFYLHDARPQTRKLQTMGERRDRALKELHDRLCDKEQDVGVGASEKPNFWETSSFKFVVSMSMLILVVFSKR